MLRGLSQGEGLMERQGMIFLLKAGFGRAGFGQFSKGEALLCC